MARTDTASAPQRYTSYEQFEKALFPRARRLRTRGAARAASRELAADALRALLKS